jgi:tetratricopeptide (TPR) repeat protein
MRNIESKTIDLRDQLSKALQAGRFTQALDLYELIEKRKPDEPRWAHRKGDLLRRMGRGPDAVIAYERAVHLYSAKGFDARATATAKLVLTLDPNRGEVLEWANCAAARGFEQHSGNAIPPTY